MNNFEDIIGNNAIISHLKSAIEMDKVSHAYILDAPSGYGKMLIAKAFAKTLQCEESGTSPCNACQSCLLFDSNNHPDFHIIEKTKKRGLGVDEIRDGLNRDIYIKPYRFRKKIYIINEADSMTEQAQNALLKTIEEPPSYGVIILLAENSNRFLPTILSRCVLIKLKPIKESDVREYLIEEHGMKEKDASLYASFSRGNIGRALQFSMSESFYDMRQIIADTIEIIIQQSEEEIFAQVQKMLEYKDEMTIFCNIFLTWLRDLLVLKKIDDEGMVIHKDKYKTLLKQSASLSYNRLCKLIENLENLRYYQQVNINLQLSLETMLLDD